jgi:DNA polymerase III epsilon subunit-like protein
MNIISLDIETTGLDADKHNVISIGAVNPTDGYEFYREIYYEDLYVSAKTQAFLKIDFSKIEKSQKSEPYIVICDFNTWLINQYNYKPITAMGLNVGSFDLQFIKKLSQSTGSPRTMELFDYRSLDLNSVMIYMLENQYRFSKLSFTDFKNEKTKQATELLKTNRPKTYELGIHHALFDAWFNVYLWEILKK